MPPELPKSWSYIQHAWNTSARTPVASAIESAAKNGDEKVVIFRLFGDGSKVKKKKKKKKNKTCSTLRLTLPDGFDIHPHRVAALVNHFTTHHVKQPKQLYSEAVQYQPLGCEIDYITSVLAKCISDASTTDMSATQIYRELILSTDLLSEYRGAGWDQWMIREIKRILQQPVPPPVPTASDKSSPTNRAQLITMALSTQGIQDPDMITFVVALCDLAGPARSPADVVDQWATAIKTCSSHWCPPPLWWCVGAVLSGEKMESLTRECEGNVTVAATSVENWDMLAVIHLLQSGVFPAEVHDAVHLMNEYTRRDIAHERFDFDWQRDWSCMADLLAALGCRSEATELRVFCQSKHHAIHAGRLRFALMMVVKIRTN